jgi:hypothetical protein
MQSRTNLILQNWKSVLTPESESEQHKLNSDKNYLTSLSNTDQNPAGSHGSGSDPACKMRDPGHC